MDDDLGRLARIGAVLDEADIQWWVSYGTLLGLARDGDLIPWDGDIDLSAWAQPQGWDGLPARFAAAGWDVEVRTFRGMIVKYKLRRAGARRIDVKVWRTHDDIAWAPAISRTPHPRTTPRGIAYRVVARLTQPSNFFTRSRLTMRAGEMLGFHVHCCVLPVRLIGHRTWVESNDGHRFPAPIGYRELLDHQYGDWRIPVKEWDFKHDDPTYVFERPPHVEATPPFG